MQKLIALVLLLVALNVQAGSFVFQAKVEAPMPKVYQNLYQELEKRKLWVVFEPDMGRTVAGLAKRLGEDYNRNGLEGMRSLVVCNAWYINRVSNLDPEMLALCPLRVTVTHKNGFTTMLFARPSVHAKQSPALPVIEEIEGMVIEAIKAARSRSLTNQAAR